MPRLLLSFAALVVVSTALAHEPLVGRYRMHVPADAARLAKLAGKDEPYGRLDLRDGDRFVLITEDAYRRGHYTIDGDRLILTPDKGDEIRGSIRDGLVRLEGLDFDRVDTNEGRRFPTDASSGRRSYEETRRDTTELPKADPVPAIMPAPVAIPEPILKTKPASPDPDFVPPAAPKPAPVIRLEARDVAGTWTVHRNGIEEKGQRMELKKDGTFRFSMTNATSEGTWTVENNRIILVWTKVDGESVEPGTMRKELPIADDAGAFRIDTYRYERSSER